MRSRPISTSGDQPNHGNAGPIVIQRYKPTSWAPVNRVMYEACLELGVPEARDLNAADGQAGVIGPMPHNRYKEVRLGTLVTYLRAARSRPNLTIQADCLVDRVLLSGAKATGVSYLDREGRGGIAHAEEIVLSAWVYNTAVTSELQRDRPGRVAAAARHSGRRRPRSATTCRPSRLRHALPRRRG